MHSLPQELVDRISSFLDFDDLKNTLYISRGFQSSAEKHSGAFRSFTLTPENTETFLHRYRYHRLQYLREVILRPSFPALKLYKGDEDEEDDFGDEDDEDDEEQAEKDEDEKDGEEDDDAFEKTQNKRRETKQDLDSRDQDFTRQMQVLFSTLQRLDSLSSGHIHLRVFTPTLNAKPSEWGVQRNFVSWRVHLLSPDSLPSVNCVRALTVERPEERPQRGIFPPSLRKLDSRVILDLANKLPNLVALTCKIGGDEWYSNYRCDTEAQAIYRYITHDWKGPRRDSRHDFGNALATGALKKLRHAHLDFLYPLEEVEDIDQRWSVPDLTSPASHDPFSSSLRLLSYHLRTMHIRVAADQTLFWPAGGAAPSWPMLENLHVVFHMSTPSGSWYFNGPLGKAWQVDVPNTYVDDDATDEYPPLADTEQDKDFDDETADMHLNIDELRYRFRVVPNEDALVPFLAGFPRAALEMPALRTFAIWSPVRYSVPTDSDDEEEDEEQEDGNGSEVVNLSRISSLLYDPLNSVALAWGIAYTRPHERAFSTQPGENGSQCRQIWWRTGTWRPDAELCAQFMRIGREAYGEEVLEYHDLEGLGERWDFLDHGERCADWKDWMG